jgi:hypothetical protein
VLLYGHLDKQPEMTGWDEGLGPVEPVRKGDKLYGRGGADDGYAIFGRWPRSMALQRRRAHARCVVLIEACEESGSYDLPAYVDHLAERIGKPSLVVCLDSGCGNYDQLWCTTSLRGMAGGNLTVEGAEEGVHSGDASGIVPSSFRIIRASCCRGSRTKATGRILVEGLHVEIPRSAGTGRQGRREVLGDRGLRQVPVPARHDADGQDLTELVLNRTWRPALSITGADGMPRIVDGRQRAAPAHRGEAVACACRRRWTASAAANC